LEEFFFVLICGVIGFVCWHVRKRRRTGTTQKEPETENEEGHFDFVNPVLFESTKLESFSHAIDDVFGEDFEEENISHFNPPPESNDN
jgi:hypothetical protein